MMNARWVASLGSPIGALGMPFNSLSMTSCSLRSRSSWLRASELVCSSFSSFGVRIVALGGWFGSFRVRMQLFARPSAGRAAAFLSVSVPIQLIGFAVAIKCLQYLHDGWFGDLAII